jgi:hypothetical protein
MEYSLIFPLFLHYIYIYILEEIKIENFNISENNIICVEFAKGIRVFGPTLILRNVH